MTRVQRFYLAAHALLADPRTRFADGSSLGDKDRAFYAARYAHLRGSLGHPHPHPEGDTREHPRE